MIDNIELETVEYDGKTYQIGAYYEFSDSINFKNSVAGVLEAISVNESYPFESHSQTYNYCREFKGNPITIGTITKTPIKMRDGTLVMFDCGSSTENVGKVYTSITGVKMIDFVQNSRFVEASKCENIVKLVPEV